MRRLPIYLVIDTSESMVGEPIQAVESGLAEMLLALRKDPYALEMAYLSVITFGTTAKQITPLTELIQFQTPKLILGSGTALGAGLELLEKRLDAEVVKTTANDKGDYRPLVFLFTDGEPTDSWQAVADRFMHNRCVLTVAVGCGPDTNYNTLRRITETVIAGDKADQQTLSTFFKFVSSSIATASASVDATGETKISLAKLPIGNGIKIVDANTSQPVIEPNRFVFLHCKCTNKKNFYLMKYVKSGSDFRVAGTFPLDEFDQTTGPAVQVAAEKLTDTAPCPYCGSPRVGKCSCGKTLCLPVAPPARPCTVIIAVDTSGSMSGNPVEESRNAAMKFVRKVDLARFQIGVMAFADSCKMIANPISDVDAIKKALGELPRYVDKQIAGWDNKTDPFDDCKRTLESASYRENKKVILVLADGVWNYQDKAIKKAKDCHKVGIDVVALGFGGADAAFLKAIASSSKDALFTDLSKLGSAFENVAQNLLTAGGSGGGGLTVSCPWCGKSNSFGGGSFSIGGGGG